MSGGAEGGAGGAGVKAVAADIRSMTGRGSGGARCRLAIVEVEISAVNRRQLDIALTLPRGMGGLEGRIDGVVREYATRGSLTGEVRVKWRGCGAGCGVRVDGGLAEAAVGALRGAAARLGLADDLKASDLLGVPGVVTVVRDGWDAGEIWPTVEKALRQALRALCAMRRREGGMLARDILRRVKVLEGLRVGLGKDAPRAAAAYRGRLLRRLAEAGIPEELARDDRLLREVALFAERVDVTEELTRLGAHLQAVRETLAGGGPMGRALDFFAQELGREINTLGAKVNDARAGKKVVAFKAELERIREQVQNLE